MNRAVQIILGVIAVGFLATAVIVLMQQLTGEREQTWLLPCLLAAGSLGSGWFAWYFGDGVGETEACTSDEAVSEEVSTDENQV